MQKWKNYWKRPTLAKVVIKITVASLCAVLQSVDIWKSYFRPDHQLSCSKLLGCGALWRSHGQTIQCLPSRFIGTEFHAAFFQDAFNKAKNGRVSLHNKYIPYTDVVAVCHPSLWYVAHAGHHRGLIREANSDTCQRQSPSHSIISDDTGRDSNDLWRC